MPKKSKNGSKMKKRMGGGRMMTKTRSRGGAVRRRSGGRAR